METSNTKPSYRSRGRIAQVLAQARASLNEPSRPFTPASLDARTSLSILSNDHQHVSNIKLKSAQSILHQQLRDPNSFSSSRISNTDTSELDFSSEYSTHQINVNNQSQPNIYSKSQSKRSSNNSEQHSRDNQKNNNIPNLQLIIYDIQDILSSLDSEIISYQSSHTSSLEYSSISKSLENLSSNVDKLFKTLKEVIILPHTAQKDISKLYSEISTTLSRIIQGSSFPFDLQYISYRLLLKLALSQLNRIDDNAAIPPDTAHLFLHTLQNIYEIIASGKSETVNINSNIKKTVKTNSNQVTHERHSQLPEPLNPPQAKTKGKGIEDDDILTVGAVDLITTFLTIIWNRFPLDVNKELLSNTSVNLTLSFPSFGTALQASAYAAGIIRYFSNSERYRRLLNHVGAVELIGTGLAAIARCLTSHLHTVSASNNTSNTSQSKVKPEVCILTGKLVAQLTAAGRNFSLDSTGRSQLLHGKTICILCNLLPLFKNSAPEVLLNCVRVTAKLSLLEPFRSQINAKAVNIKCLVDVIIGEAQQCQQIMDGGSCIGGTVSSTAGQVEWPAWHTWPLLSRVAFTLGNLTTSNNTNRLIIGIECKGLKPLVLLLQACACSISQLSQLKDLDNDDEEDSEASDNDNDKGISNTDSNDDYDVVQHFDSSPYEPLPLSLPVVSTSTVARNAYSTKAVSASNVRDDSDSSWSDDNDEDNDFDATDDYSKQNYTARVQPVSPALTGNGTRNAYMDKGIEDIEDIDERYGDEYGNDYDIYVIGDDDEDEDNDFEGEDIPVGRYKSHYTAATPRSSVKSDTSKSQSKAKGSSNVVDDKSKSKVQKHSDKNNDKVAALEREDGDDNEDVNGATSAGEQELVDSTVKLLRLLANLSIDESIGKYLASRPEPFQMLLELLSCTKNLEELLLNVVATCTNLTFYACNMIAVDHGPRDGGGLNGLSIREVEKIESVLRSLSLHLSQCLFHENEELVLETVRALGNLTRRKAVLGALRENRMDEALVLLLGHSNRAVTAAVTGSLINFSADVPSREALMKQATNICIPLTSVLRKASLKDLDLSLLVCQVLHNLFSKDTSPAVREAFADNIPCSVEDTLKELIYCAEDLVSSSNSSEDSDQDDKYREFVRVGRLVLESLDEIF